jgi:hypothetical protein
MMAKNEKGQSVEISDDPVLFPEIDNTPETKKLIAAAKAYKRANDRHAVSIAECKPAKDDARDKLIGLMHEAKLSSFKYKSLKVQLLTPAEKVSIEGADDGDE